LKQERRGKEREEEVAGLEEERVKESRVASRAGGVG